MKVAGSWQERAGYTNAAGLAEKSLRNLIIDGLLKFGFDRIEVSRHHFDSNINQAIMNFRKYEKIMESDVFESVIKILNNQLPVTLVCIIQRDGISSYDQIENYLEWARRLGVSKVIFRELCDVPISYKNNRTFIKINLERKGIEKIVQSWLEKKGAKINYFINGYYFWNANFTYNRTEVVFERSDYSTMNRNHSSDTIHKLVFFPNGNLCSGWEPYKQVLYSAELI